MAGGGSTAWCRRGTAKLRRLRALVKETQRALSDVAGIVNIEQSVSTKVQELEVLCGRSAALLLSGRTWLSQVRVLHALLGCPLLPDCVPGGTRWIRIKYGVSTQVQLSLGNSDFELLEELECVNTTWDVIPVQDLLRRDDTDLTTVLDIQINNTFLKDSLIIIIPPNIGQETTADITSLKDTYKQLYSKREAIMKTFNVIYLYAIDAIGRNVFAEQISDTSFTKDWQEFSNMYYLTRGDNTCQSESCDTQSVSNASTEPYVLSAENCLDLLQFKEINAKSQVFFILLSDSVEVTSRSVEKQIGSCRSNENFSSEVTESTEGRDSLAEELAESDQVLVREDLLYRSDSPLSAATVLPPVMFHMYNWQTEEDLSSAGNPGADDTVLGAIRHPDREKNIVGFKLELYEEQVAFMVELIEQWRLISTSSSCKDDLRNNWIILNDEHILEINNPSNNPLAPFLEKESRSPKGAQSDQNTQTCVNDRLVQSKQSFLSKVMKFAAQSVQCYVLEYCTQLSEIHTNLLQQFILASFDLARELQVVPKKIQYVATQEQNLFETINEKFSEGNKKQELVQIMQDVLLDMKTDVNDMDWSVDDLPYHQDNHYVVPNSIFYTSNSSHVSADDKMSSQDGVEEAASCDSYNFDDYEIIHSVESSVYGPPVEPLRDNSQISSIRVDNESDVFSVNSSIVRFGTRLIDQNAQTKCTNNTQISIKQASLDVQKTVLGKLSRKISLRLVEFVDCLRDSYFGTLQRCLESLEASCMEELGGQPATEAMRQVLSVARQVDLQCCASFPILRTLIESVRRLCHRLRLVNAGAGANSCCVLSPAWRRRVALHTVHSLSAHKLARIISSQILDRMSSAHERYQGALASLENALQDRLHHTEDVRLAIRKKYAPGFARLCLESTSMCDLLQYGMPELGREIGRGQYGVVFACKGPWAGHEPCAVKSVLPADDRHFNELAMEFFYTRSIPPHPRIVQVLGSLVTHDSGTPTVLLVCERKSRDLHCAVRAGLSFKKRLRVAVDIVHGIRYLHSLGLVHRDIKMKNVLLDQLDRASLSDLGFCAPGALMSGSIVGTPVHMAPELLAGTYDASVDVYAFGILFWYICAGNIKLPSAFEAFHNKEQLWSKVRRGLRPERLPHFTDACWELMQACWHSVPSRRPLLGDVQATLETLYENVECDNDQPPSDSETSSS